MRLTTAAWLLFLAAILASPLGIRAWHHLSAPRLLHAGDRLSALSLVTTSNTGFTLAPHGKAQIINVFATWCEPCRQEAPSFAQAARALQARGFSVIGIDQEESPARVAQFAQAFQLPYDVYIDTVGLTRSVLGARMIPTTIFVGRDGRIRWIHAGPLDARMLMDLTQNPQDAG